MLSLYLKSVGILAPGIKNWNDAMLAFKQPEHFLPSDIDKKLETLLPANERRRASRVTQLALSAAQQTGHNDFSQCLQIFSSSNGDITTFHQISTALGMEGRPVSPTRFHNSVHNAAAGYWSIATQSQTASTSLTAYNDSLSAGLLETAVQFNASDNDQNRDCLLVCYDEKPPAPFEPIVPITESFACAFRFSVQNSNNLDHNIMAKLDISLNTEILSENRMANNNLEALRLSNPQARALPLLEAVALQKKLTIHLPYVEQTLAITVTPFDSDFHR